MSAPQCRFAAGLATVDQCPAEATVVGGWQRFPQFNAGAKVHDETGLYWCAEHAEQLGRVRDNLRRSTTPPKEAPVVTKSVPAKRISREDRAAMLGVYVRQQNGRRVQGAEAATALGMTVNSVRRIMQLAARLGYVLNEHGKYGVTPGTTAPPTETPALPATQAEPEAAAA